MFGECKSCRYLVRCRWTLFSLNIYVTYCWVSKIRHQYYRKSSGQTLRVRIFQHMPSAGSYACGCGTLRGRRWIKDLARFFFLVDRFGAPRFLGILVGWKMRGFWLPLWSKGWRQTPQGTAGSKRLGRVPLGPARRCAAAAVGKPRAQCCGGLGGGWGGVEVGVGAGVEVGVLNSFEEFWEWFRKIRKLPFRVHGTWWFGCFVCFRQCGLWGAEVNSCYVTS